MNFLLKVFLQRCCCIHLHHNTLVEPFDDHCEHKKIRDLPTTNPNAQCMNCHKNYNPHTQQWE